MMMNGVVTVSMEEIRLFNSNQQCVQWAGGLNSAYTLIPCAPAITGRYVQMQLMADTKLILYEVEVYGY